MAATFPTRESSLAMAWAAKATSTTGVLNSITAGRRVRQRFGERIVQ
jgi:hypothetical protein